jgi:hypothetical protein
MTRTARIAAVVLGLAASAAAQDGGALSWRGKTEDPRAAMADARQQGLPMMLFFTSDG